MPLSLLPLALCHMHSGNELATKVHGCKRRMNEAIDKGSRGFTPQIRDLLSTSSTFNLLKHQTPNFTLAQQLSTDVDNLLLPSHKPQPTTASNMTAADKVNWNDVETWQRVVAALLATGIKPDLKQTATFFGTTYDTLENRFRKIKKDAQVLKDEVNSGQRGEVTAPSRARSAPNTPRKPKTPKKDALGSKTFLPPHMLLDSSLTMMQLSPTAVSQSPLLAAARRKTSSRRTSTIASRPLSSTRSIPLT